MGNWKRKLEERGKEDERRECCDFIFVLHRTYEFIGFPMAARERRIAYQKVGGQVFLKAICSV